MLTLASRSRRTVRHISGLAVAALLVVSLLASGHHHSSNQSQTPESCPLCMVKADTPALIAPPIPLLAPALHAVALVLEPAAKLVSIYQPFNAGRAPPGRAPIHAV